MPAVIMGKSVLYRLKNNEANHGNSNGHDVHPAVITNVFRDGSGNVTYVNLKVFCDMGPILDVGSASYSDTEPGCWFWQEGA